MAHRATVLRLEPRLASVPEILARLPRAPSDLVPDETLEIPLGPEETMLTAMKPKGRYNVRLALRHGVEIEFSKEPASVDALYPVLEATGLYHDFRVEPRNFFLNLARTLLPAEMGEIVLARYRGMLFAPHLSFIMAAERLIFTEGMCLSLPIGWPSMHFIGV